MKLSPTHPAGNSWWKSVSLYQFVRTAIARYQRLGGLNDKNLFLHCSSQWSPRRNVGRFGFFFWYLSPWFADNIFLAATSCDFFLWVGHPGVSLCIISFSCKNTSQIGLGHTSQLHFKLILFLKALSPTTVLFWGRKLRALTYELGWGGAQFSPGQFVEKNHQTGERNKSETVKRLLVCLRINHFFCLCLN